MLLGFKQRFVPFVEDGSKTHTIRATRKISPKVGEICHCYTGLRQKGARLLGRWDCVKIQNIQINWLEVPWGMSLLIAIDGENLDDAEANALAFADGFRSRGVRDALGEMHAYWHQLHGADAFPFSGHLIHWRYTR